VKRDVAKRRLDEDLLPLIDKWQAENPAALLSRAFLARYTATELGVTRQATSQRISKAVAETGELIEIFPGRDWVTVLPGGEDLPQLYAYPKDLADVTYRLTYDKPYSRGAGSTSFIISPSALKILLDKVRTEYNIPAPVNVPVFRPKGEQLVRPMDYRRMVKKLIASSPTKLTASEAQAILLPVLEVLQLRVPIIPQQGRTEGQE
jgi:hypothetical protein